MAKQRLQWPLKSKMHNSAIYGPILLNFCMEVAHVSGLKLYLAAFVKEGQTKAAKGFKVQNAKLCYLQSDFVQILHGGSSQLPSEISISGICQKRLNKGCKGL